MLKKYLNYLISIAVLFFSFSIKINALTCDYVAPYNSLSGNKEVKISCTLSSSENECRIDTEGANNKEAIINWKDENITGFKAYDYVVNNNKCPSQVVFITSNVINGYKIYAADSESTASNIITTLKQNTGKDYRVASSTSNISDTKIEKAYKDIENYTQILESFANDFSVDNCIENEKIITRISECKQTVQAKKMNKSTLVSNVKSYVDTNVVDAQDNRVKAFYEAVDKFEKKLEQVNKRLEEEQKKIDIEMGLESGSNITITEDEQSNDIDIKYLSNICTESRSTVLVIRVIGYVLLIAKILVPVALIIFGTISFAQTVISGSADDTKKTAMGLMWKFIAAIVIFVLPTLINFVIGLIDGATDGVDDYENCRNCIFDPNDCKIPVEEGD